MRTFETGATRDQEEGKLDYEGFFSPLVIIEVAKYLNKHRIQADGQLRDSDNWQKGIPRSVYMKSLFRHFMDLWKLHRGLPAIDSKTNEIILIEEACSAVLFNAMGYLFEVLNER